MEINLNVKIRAGKRIPVEVAVYGTAVKKKTLEFGNGKTISETAIAQWIQSELLKALQKIQAP